MSKIIVVHYFFHKLTVNNAKTGKSSKRPNTMNKINSHLDGIANDEKFPAGPISEDVPGPTPIAVTTAVITV